MSVSSLFNCFCIFSFMGWLYECIYCSIKTKHWQNRGFLFGPICPIYGVGADLCVVVFGILPGLLGIHISADMSEIPVWQIFLISCIGSIIIEYSTSYVLEKVFHSLWWDNSEVPLNINGRVCLPATLGFGAAGILIVKFIVPVALSSVGKVNPPLSESASLILMFIFGSDFALTVDSLVKLTEKLENAQQLFDEKMENGYQRFAQTLNVHELQQLKNIHVYIGHKSHKERKRISTYYGKFKNWITAHEPELKMIGKKSSSKDSME